MRYEIYLLFMKHGFLLIFCTYVADKHIYFYCQKNLFTSITIRIIIFYMLRNNLISNKNKIRENKTKENTIIIKERK